MFSAIEDIDTERLLASDIEEIVSSLVVNYRLEVPTLDTENITIHVPTREGTKASKLPKRSQFSVQISVPFRGDGVLFGLHPGWYPLDLPIGNVVEQRLQVLVEVLGMRDEIIRGAIDNQLLNVERYLHALRARVEKFNSQLSGFARDRVERQRTLTFDQRTLLTSIGFPIQAEHIVLEPKAPSATAKTAALDALLLDPTFDDQSYSKTLDVIENMAFVMERSPSAFASMGEEDLRQHFLVQLNGRFKGAASGETFNNTGKTDILIRVGGHNIFIAECKFWNGSKVFTETIDQLLRYLTWRDTQAAVIIFNRNKDFSNVLRSIQEATDAHPNKERGPNKDSDTRLRYVFRSLTDPNREIFLTILAFDVPSVSSEGEPAPVDDLRSAERPS